MGLGGLMVTAVLTMLTVENALNAIWRVRRPRPLAQRVLVYWATLTFGPVLIGASLSISSYLISVSAGYVGTMPFGVGLLVSMVPVLLSALAFAFLYTTVPNAYVDWRDAIVAGLVAALAFELAKRGFGYFITHIPTYTVVYGTFAALPIFLLWIYLSWLVTLLGATIAANLPVIRQATGAGAASPAASSSTRSACSTCCTRHATRCRAAWANSTGPQAAGGGRLTGGAAGQAQGHAPVGRLQQERGQAHWALLCDPSCGAAHAAQPTGAQPAAPARTALAQQLQGGDELKAMLDNPQLDRSLESVFRQAEYPAGGGDGGSEDRQGAPPHLEVVPPGWHGCV